MEKSFIVFLADYLSVKVDDVETGVHEFFSTPLQVTSAKTPTPKGNTIAKKTPPSTASVKSDKVENKKDENHTCMHQKRDKSLCGNNAKRSLKIDGKEQWFCGTEKSGCYAARLKTNAKKELADTADTTVKNAVKGKAVEGKGKAPTTNAERKKASDNNAKSLLVKVIEQKEINCISKNTKSHGKLHMDKSTRALCDPKTSEWYGVLDEDNDTILPIDNKTMKWLEGNNCIIRQTGTNKTQAKHRSREVKKESSSEEVSSEEDSGEEETAEDSGEEETVEDSDEEEESED